MKKSLLVWLIQLITMPTLAQDKDFDKNIIAFETGIWSRGTIGISYTRNYFKTNCSHLSTDVSSGFGFNWKSAKVYHVLTQAINFGSDDVFFIAGAEVKYCMFPTNGFLFDSETFYTGWTWSPVLGVVKQSSNGFTFRGRISYLSLEGGALQRPSFNISLGYSF